jgi:hypothetical protein
LVELSPARSCLYVGSDSAGFYLASAPRCPDSCTCVMYWYKLLYCYTIILLDRFFCLHGVLLSLCPIHMPQFRHLLSSYWSLKSPSCFSRSCSANAALASAASQHRCAASFRSQGGVAASPCTVFCAASICTCAGVSTGAGRVPPLGIADGDGLLHSLHLLLSFDCRRRPDIIGLLDKLPASSAFLPSRASSLTRFPTLLTPPTAV